MKPLAVAFVASMFAIASAHAEPTKPSDKKSFEVGMYRVVNTMKMNVLVEKIPGTWVEIRLKDSRNETVHVEFAQKKLASFSKRFDLTGLEDGKYTFEITNGKETVKKEFELSTKVPNPSDIRSITIQ